MAKTRAVSFSELDNARQCRFKHQLGYVERWQDPNPSAALQKGSLMHEVLELHYRRLKEGMKLPGIVQEVQTSGLLYDDLGNSDDIQELVAWIYDGYVRLYADDPEWEIVDVEFPVGGWLYTPAGTRSSFWFKGKVDLLVRERTRGSLWVVDHKSGRRLPKDKDLDFEDQMPLYIQSLRRKGLDIRGAIYNACRTEKLVRAMTDDERFTRVLMARPDKELEAIEMEVYKTMLDVYRPREGDAPRSPDADRCGWRCGFTEPCLAGRKGGDTRQMLRDMGFVQNFERH
jgi:hypothetical protein